MTQDCAYQLTSYEPIVQGIFRVDYNADGWQLWARHRHYGGMLQDCRPFECSQLTTEELSDVLGALVEGWGPFSGRGVDGENIDGR